MLDIDIQWIAELKIKIGAPKVQESTEALAAMQKDKSPLAGGLPSVRVNVETDTDVKNLLQIASQYKIPVVARGAGTGTTGGAIPIKGCILLSLEKMNRILEIDTENRMVVCEPGVITGNLSKAVEEKGLFYPPDPASLEICSIGGNIAENAGGPRAFKYGVTRDYVIGLEGYFANGEPFKFGGKQLKNVAGYDMIALLVGSEGTLGIVTKITLKLRVLPPYRQSMLLVFPSVPELISVANQVFFAGIEPACMELIDGFCLSETRRFLHDPSLEKSLGSATGPALLIECDGNFEEGLHQGITKIARLAEKHGCVEKIEAADRESQALIWKLRRNISHALRALSPDKMSEDIVVPPAKLARLFSILHDDLSRDAAQVLGFGHIGDGNVHVNILRKTSDNKIWQVEKEKIRNQLFDEVMGLGGSLSGEHGIGLTKKAFLSQQYPYGEINKMKQIKAVLDPQNILNPTKIF